MTAPVMHRGNEEQVNFWNGPGGKLWSQKYATQDQVLAPVSEALMAHAAIKAGERVIDIGCGCGSTTLEISAKVGPSGRITAIDVSSDMLAVARARVPAHPPVEFLLADATIHPFAPASADVLLSRFGVMFFAEPALSFTNLRRAMKPGGRLVFACWRNPAENHWAMVPLKAAYQHVPPLPKAEPDDPGMFSFANADRVTACLAQAGFEAIVPVPVDLTFDLGLGQGLDVAVQLAQELGPTMRALKDQPSDVRAAAAASIRAALAPLQVGSAVPVAAAIWIFTARSP